MDIESTKALQREILLSFWKIHILHHAGNEPLVGSWMLQELRRHGYEVSPGTLYPMLHRMEKLGWLRCKKDFSRKMHDKRLYYLTGKGRKALAAVRVQLDELIRELNEKHVRKTSR